MDRNWSGARPECALEGVKILIVEDSWHVAHAMKSLLTDLGMRPVGPASTVRDAMTLFEQHRPDLAIVDVNLKQELATDLIANLSELGVNVIVATGYAFPVLQPKSYKALLQKPFRADDLLNAVRVAAKQRTGTANAEAKGAVRQ